MLLQKAPRILAGALYPMRIFCSMRMERRINLSPLAWAQRSGRNRRNNAARAAQQQR